MSASICRRCFTLIQHGQKVSFLGTADFKALKSNITSAIDLSTLELDPESLVHSTSEDCKYDDEYQV